MQILAHREPFSAQYTIPAPRADQAAAAAGCGKSTRYVTLPRTSVYNAGGFKELAAAGPPTEAL